MDIWQRINLVCIGGNLAFMAVSLSQGDWFWVTLSAIGAAGGFASLNAAAVRKREG